MSEIVERRQIASIPFIGNDEQNEIVDHMYNLLKNTYGHVTKEQSTQSVDEESETVFLIWNRIEIQYDLDNKFIQIYKLLVSDKKESLNKNEEDNGIDANEKRIDVVIESIILTIISLNNENGIDTTYSSHIEKEQQDIVDPSPIISLFKEQFGPTFAYQEAEDASVTRDLGMGTIVSDKMSAQVDFQKLKVIKCNSNPLRGRIESLLSIGRDLTQPLC